MDSITQGLLGATVAECGFRHRLGRSAAVMGAVGGVLPDLDFVLGAIDPWWSWEYHRHFTHSVVFAPIGAAPLAWLFWRRKRSSGYWLWYLCAYLAIATHPLLDLCTTYGTQLFVPLSSARLGLDWIAIVDPFYSLILLCALILCTVLSRRGRTAWTTHTGLAAMALSTAYLLYGAWNHHIALQRIYRAAETQGQNVLAARAIPQVGSLFVWRLIYRTPDAYYVGRTNTRFDRKPTFTCLPAPDDPLIRQANEHPRVRFFAHFTMGWARPMLHKTNAGSRVVYDDFRYGWLPDEPGSLWSVVVDFDRDGRIVSVQRGSRHRRGSAGEIARSLWRENQQP